MAFAATSGETVSVTPNNQQPTQNAAPVQFTNVNVVDPDMVRQALNTRAGNDLILNVIQNNPETLRPFFQ